MPYTSPKGKIGPIDDRALVCAVPIVDGEKNATIELMKQLPNVTAYGMLLLDDPKHPMAELVRERWSEISNMTGDRFLLFSFERPAEWTQNYMQYWRNKLGNQFDSTWKKWQDPPDPGAAYGYLSLFKPPLNPKQLPCLVLFTDPEKRQAIVRPIPNWDKSSLYELLKGIITVVQEASEKPEAERLEWLRKELTSPSARFLTAAGHVGSRALDYFKQHPALVTSTAISVVLGLSGAGLFTLPAVAVSVLNVVKDTISGTKSAAA
jgi:hypothetical protein